MMLPPADQPAPRHWAGPARRDTTGAAKTIRAGKEPCPLNAYPKRGTLITYTVLTVGADAFIGLRNGFNRFLRQITRIKEGKRLKPLRVAIGAGSHGA